MGLLDWLASALPDEPGEGQAVVACDDTAVGCAWPDGTKQALTWAELCWVAVDTTDAGPFREDVFFVLGGPAGECKIPQGARGTSALLERLQALPGFDHEAFIAAMSSTKNQRFVCWRAPGSGASVAE